MARLIATVYVKDPESADTVRLDAGSEPEPRLAALVTNPAAWEDGKFPTAAKKAAEEQQTDTSETAASSTEDDGGDTKQAAKKTAARPARGRKSAAGEGTSS